MDAQRSAQPWSHACRRGHARNSRSAKKIGEELRRVAQFPYDEANKPDEDIFGPVPRAKRADVLGRLSEQSSPPNLEVPGRQQPVRGDLRAQTPDAAAEADGAGTEAGRPAEDAQAAALAEAPTAEPFKTNGADWGRLLMRLWLGKAACLSPMRPMKQTCSATRYPPPQREGVVLGVPGKPPKLGTFSPSPGYKARKPRAAGTPPAPNSSPPGSKR